MTSLKSHLERCPKKGNTNITESVKPSKISKQINKTDKDTFLDLMVRYVAGDYNSFLSVESSNLINLIQFGVELGYKYGNIELKDSIPKRKQVRAHVFNLAKKYREELKKDAVTASKYSCLSITTDIWTDGVVRNSYLDASIFYVDENFNLKHGLIAFKNFPESHTAAEIFNKIEEIASIYKIDHLKTPYVTDSGANVKAAFRNGEWYPCICHRFHTIINDSWNSTLSKDAEIRLTYDKMLAVRRVLHQSSNLESQIPRKLPNDVPTRAWLSLSNFFEAFISSYDKIHELFEERDVTPPTDKRLVKEISDAFKSLDFVFKTMEEANRPTLHLVLVNLSKVPRVMDSWPGRMSILRNEIFEGLVKKWVSEINQCHFLALGLHPNYKSLTILQQSTIMSRFEVPDMKTVIGAISETINDQAQTRTGEVDDPEIIAVETIEPSDSSATLPKLNDQVDEFMDPIDVIEEQSHVELDVFGEYDQFLKEKIAKVYANPLDYWKESSHKKLAKVAAGVYCIPASSAEPERHNSAAGATITKMRSRLAPEVVEELVFVNEFMKNQ